MFSYIFMKILERRPRSYDSLMDRASWGRIKALKQAVIEEVSVSGRILEIGCGTGELAIMLADHGAMVDGFDISPAMVAQARKRIITDNLTNSVSIRHMGIDGMDGLPDSHYQTVISALVFSELSDDERRFALKHSARTLKPDGLLVIADEVVPRKTVNRVLHTIVRIPMMLAAYLVSRATTQPITDLTGEISAAGFTIEKEIRTHGDAFAMVVGRLIKDPGP